MRACVLTQKSEEALASSASLLATPMVSKSVDSCHSQEYFGGGSKFVGESSVSLTFRFTSTLSPSIKGHVPEPLQQWQGALLKCCVRVIQIGVRYNLSRYIPFLEDCTDYRGGILWIVEAFSNKRKFQTEILGSSTAGLGMCCKH